MIVLYSLIVLFLPLAIHSGCTHIYKSVNEYYYGVYETNTRTKGELGEFVSNIYKIDSESRTPEIWAPFDAIEKAFEASPTLKQYPKLLRCIEKSSWVGGNIHKNPISGDFLTWVMRDALVEADMWKSEEQVQQLFGKINEELEQAFKNGTLKTDEKIQLISSMGGRSLKEIFQLKEVVIEEYKSLILLKGYEPGGTLTQGMIENVSDKASFYTNNDLYPLSQKMSMKRQQEIDMTNSIITVIFKAYAILYPVMCLLTVLGIIVTVIYQLIIWIRNRKVESQKVAIWFIVISLIGISLAYTISIGWFSSFLDKDSWPTVLKFYSVGAIPLMILMELMGAYLSISGIKNVFKKKKSIE